jgi:hypothetical protein
MISGQKSRYIMYYIRYDIGYDILVDVVNISYSISGKISYPILLHYRYRYDRCPRKSPKLSTESDDGPSDIEMDAASDDIISGP